MKLVSQSDIDQAYKSYFREFEGQKNDYFGLLWLNRKFGINDIGVAKNYVAFGNNDYGIDGFYFDKDQRNLYLMQFKWSSNHSLFEESFHRLTDFGMERIFGKLSQDSSVNLVLKRLTACLIENYSLINQVFVWFVFDGDEAKAANSKTMQSLKEDLDDKYEVIRKYFGDRDVRYITGFKSNDEDWSVFVPSVQTKVHAYDLDVRETIKIETPSGDKLLITFVTLNKLLEMYRDLGERFFDQNIRSGLKRKPDTNREIQRSLKEVLSGEEAANAFAFFHNGVSLTANEIREPDGDSDNGIYHLVEPRILNGAQTTICLADFVEKNRGDSRVDQALQNIKVMARIVKSNNKNFKKKVTINTNRQNPIMPWNLMAHDEMQLKFYDKFKDELGVYYETREDAFSNLSQRELLALGFRELGSPVEITTFGQTLQAIQGQIGRISNIKETFSNPTYYKESFDRKYLGANSKKLLLLHKVQFGVNGARNEIRRKGEQRYNYITKAKYLIWALLVQGLLNDSNFEQYVEKYGTNPDLESDFRVLLKDVASTRVRFILGDTFDKPKYSQQLDKEEYSFLKSGTTFEDCMSTAKRRFGWEFDSP